MLRILTALSLVIAAPVSDSPVYPVITATNILPIPSDPHLDLSAIRYIDCTSSEGEYTGSGFLIAPHVIATARHVADGDCKDVQTGTKIKAYHMDSRHDFALMSAPDIPDNLPYVKYRCDGIKPGRTYMSYGITDYEQDIPIFRMDAIKATKTIIKADDVVFDFPHSAGMRVFEGAIAPGMSGGPVTDEQGYAYAVNNAGDRKTTLLYDLKDSILCHKSAS